MNYYEQELHFNDELFDGMREDADRVLQKLLKNMVEKDSLEGKVTIGIDVTFSREFIPNFDPSINQETRMVLIPKFSHKVGSVMQIKNEAKGDRNCEGKELVWDEEKGEYVLRPISNTDQGTIFDVQFRNVHEVREEYLEEQPTLEGRRIASLPGPCEPEDNEDLQEDMSEEFGTNPPEDIPFAGDDEDYDYEDPEGDS
jgi:hypothetical protein